MPRDNYIESEMKGKSSIDDKISIIKQLEVSSNKVKLNNTEFGKNTISDIKNKEKILTFQREMSDIGIQKKAKIMKLGNDVQHDKAVILWFKQKRMEGALITGCTKKLFNYTRSCMETSHRMAMEVLCHRIRNLSLQGKKLSADKEASDEFVSSFAEFVEQHHLTLQL